jgi:hypothetical protein
MMGVSLVAGAFEARAMRVTAKSACSGVMELIRHMGSPNLSTHRLSSGLSIISMTSGSRRASVTAGPRFWEMLLRRVSQAAVLAADWTIDPATKHIYAVYVKP